MESTTHQRSTTSGHLLPSTSVEKNGTTRAVRPRHKRRQPSSMPLIVAVDLGALVVSGLILRAPSAFVGVWAPLAVVFFAGYGSYRCHLTFGVRREGAALVAIPTLAMVLTEFFVTSRPTSTLQLLLVGIALVFAGRMLSDTAVRWVRSHKGIPTLIVGSGELGCALSRAITGHPACGLHLVGIVDDFGDTRGRATAPVLGNLASLETLIATYDVRRVIVAFGAQREATLVDVLRACSAPELEVYVLPRLFELGLDTPDELWGFPLVRASRAAMRTPSWCTKRVFDILLSGLLLVVLMPLILAGMLAVKLDSPGDPVLFRQRRVGKRGRVVEVFKLRSMPVRRDSDIRWSVADSSVGRLGRLLRRTSIDELPQLFNVLRGDMSLVGPRPERPHFVERFSREVDRYADRHRVPVGLTGWAQVHGLRGDTSIEDRARFDNYYIDNWSVWLDLVILARTLTHVLRTASSWGQSKAIGLPDETATIQADVVLREGA